MDIEDVYRELSLAEHQLAALKKLRNGKILWGGVGTGKSRVAVAYYAKNEAPKDVYVITTAKKRDDRDWEAEFNIIGIGPKSGPTLVRGGSAALRRRKNRSSDDAESESKSISDGSGSESSSEVVGRGAGSGGSGRDSPWRLTVDSWNNINKYAGIEGAFFIFDEQRLVGSGAWSKAFLRISKRNGWILLSGTPGDTWLDYVPIFIANEFYPNRTDFKRQHVIYNSFTKFPKVDRYVDVGRLVRYRSQLLVEMPYLRHTKRIPVPVPVEHDKESLNLVLKRRWNPFTEQPLRDIAELFSVARKIVNSDPSRLDWVRELWRKHPKLIVFYNFNYELEMLRSLANPISIETLGGLGLMDGNTPSSGSFDEKEEFEWKSLSEDKSKKTIEPSKNGVDPNITMNTQNRSSPRIDESEMETGKWRGSILPEFETKKAFCGKSSGPTTSVRSSELSLTETGFKTKTESSGCGDSTSTPTFTGGTRSTPISADLWTPSGNEASTIKEFSSTDITTGFSTEESSLSGHIAEWNGHKHEPIPKTDRWLYLVQYTAGAEGWNCVETDATVFYSLNYSWKVMEQAHGRIDRLNTPFRDLYYYTLVSDSWIDRAIERSLKGKENFNEAKFSKMFDQREWEI